MKTFLDMTLALQSSPPPTPTGDVSPLRAGPGLDAADFAPIRRKMLLECCKWDPQVGDISTLAPFPLLIRDNAWRSIANLAASLFAETVTAERELLRRPDLFATVAIPRRLRKALSAAARIGSTPAAARVMRFDFHWTTTGWQISEVNSDVPGGFAEASAFPSLIASHFPGTTPAGDPAEAWANAIAKIASKRGNVALLAAPGFMEDQQVVAYLGRRLEAHAITGHFARPDQIRWENGHAWLTVPSLRSISARHGETTRAIEQRHGRDAHATKISNPLVPLDAIVRFYQAEWLAALAPRHWHPFIAGGKTPVVNPGHAILTESKRFPLVWNQLTTPLPTWRQLLPETRAPRDADWRNDDRWLLKSALCNTGDFVITRSWATPARWKSACRSVWLRPGNWAAQRRFDTLPVQTPAGPLFPCIGVFVIDGACAGAYARLSHAPVVDFQAIDAALLIEPDDLKTTLKERSM